MRRKLYLFFGVLLGVGFVGTAKQAYQGIGAGENLGEFPLAQDEIGSLRDVFKNVAHGMGMTLNETAIKGSVGPIRLDPRMNPLRVSLLINREMRLGKGPNVPFVELVLVDSKASPVWTHFIRNEFNHKDEGWSLSSRGIHRRAQRGLSEQERTDYPVFRIEREDDYRLLVALDPRMNRAAATQISVEILGRVPPTNYRRLAFFGAIFIIGIVGAKLTRDERWYRRS